MAKNYFDLTDHVAVVTGASGGLGVQMAKALANQGAKIVVMARRQEKIDAVAAEIADEFGLSPRELEVFEMLAEGRDRTYIQEKLVISRNTVKAHVKHIYAKLDIHSHQDLIALAHGE